MLIVSKTPYRISLFGGGTDMPLWYKKNRGKVISTSINFYSYIFLMKNPKFFKFNYRIIYNKIEEVKAINEIDHPCVRAVIKYLNIKDKLVLNHLGELPARSGMASSSAFTTGLLRAMYAYTKEKINKRRIAKEAIHIEQNILKETVGCQDQFAVTYGGLNEIIFEKSGLIKIKKLKISKTKLKILENSLVLLFTNIQRYSSDIESSKKLNKDNLSKLQILTEECKQLLVNHKTKDLDNFGKLLNKSWIIKMSLSNKVSNRKINFLYNKALKTGALGGKLLGAGGGGMMLLYIPKEKQVLFKKKFKKYKIINIKFENRGSHIIKI